MKILEFWKSHPQYWISRELEKKADQLIYDLYFKHDLCAAHWLETVIYYDQFMRHFSRILAAKVSECDVAAARNLAAATVRAHTDELHGLSEDELMFALMPFKHIRDYEFIFNFLHSWLPSIKSFTDFPIINRFYKDTYLKYIKNTEIKVPCVSNVGAWSQDICEVCPPADLWGKGDLRAGPQAWVAALSAVARDGILWVSLSGGVDSNLMCALGRRAGLDVRAVHIVYGNREVADQEAAFIADYAAAIGVRLYMYKIPWLRRATAEREFYESTTRRLRFAVYRACGAADGICLGHIYDDVIENIWSNFAHGTHLDNLAGMKEKEIEDGVTILRPWLGMKKADIYAIAAALNIPYLQNTTPTWSNRGKFRNIFYDATHAQYGPSVDSKICEVAETLGKQHLMLDRLLYKPVFDSIVDNIVDVTPIFDAGGIDGAAWQRVLEHFCHMYLGISKPSIHACMNLSTRLTKLFETMKIPLKSDLEVRFLKSGKKVTMALIKM